MHRVIINADDFGISHDVNQAISTCFINGYINQTTLMVNMPSIDEAVQMAKEYGFSDKVGLHLNLVEGEPITEGIRHSILCNEQGVFDSAVLKKVQNRFFLDRRSSECIREEIIAQIERFLLLGIGKKHIDSHQHSHTSPSVLRILLPIMRQYKFEDLRLARNIPKSSIKGSKRVVKYLTNKVISSYNASHGRVGVKMFGSMMDVENEQNILDITEMMIHPIMKEQILSEAYSDESIEQWWIEHKNEWELI